MVQRCSWLSHYPVDALMTQYHDEEWGNPQDETDQDLFEMLSLEIFQAGLNWRIVLHKRLNLRQAFHQFDIGRVADMTADEVELLLQDTGIIRNRMKIEATIHNATCIQSIQETFGSFSNYIWHFTQQSVVNHQVTDYDAIAAKDALSERVAKDMKKRGFKFTGPVTIYAFLQSIGIINDHEVGCDFNLDNV